MRENHSDQVVEWVGLVTSSFQFFTRLASVFAEKVDRSAMSA
jgi:hypothetical protein